MVIAKMDVTRNDHPLAVVRGYLTLRLFPACARGWDGKVDCERSFDAIFLRIWEHFRPNYSEIM